MYKAVKGPPTGSTMKRYTVLLQKMIMLVQKEYKTCTK